MPPACAAAVYCSATAHTACLPAVKTSVQMPSSYKLPPTTICQLRALKHKGLIAANPCTRGRERDALPSSDADQLLQALALLCLREAGSCSESFSSADPSTCLLAKACFCYKHRAGVLSEVVSETLPDWVRLVQVCTGGHENRWRVRFGDSKTLNRLAWAEFKQEQLKGVSGAAAKILGANIDAASKVPYVDVHRLLCYMFNRKPPLGRLQACHFHCGNVHCMNPKHLCWGSAADNAMHRVHLKQVTSINRLHSDIGAEDSDTDKPSHRAFDWQPPSARERERPNRRKARTAKKGCRFGKHLV